MLVVGSRESGVGEGGENVKGTGWCAKSRDEGGEKGTVMCAAGQW